MPLRPKPDSSHASNRLTRRNGPAKHLLSNFNPTPDHEPDFEAEDESDGEFKGKAEEPATEDDPLSSSEEDASSESEAPQSPGDEAKTESKNTKTLEEKLGNGKEDASSQPKGSRRSARNAQPSQNSGSSQTLNTRRGNTISSLMGDHEDDEGGLFSSLWSSQSSKRHKTNTYSSRFKIPSYARDSSSSSLSAISSEEQSPDTTKRKSEPSANRQKAQKNDRSSGDLEVAFKVPMEIDAPSPRKSRDGEGVNGASAEFKYPASFTNDFTSSSSMGTSSSKDPQPMLLDEEDLSPASGTPLSSPSSSVLEGLARDEDAPSGDREPSPPRRALCPMCKVEVDPELLMRFEAQPKQRVREQQQFCASHKQLSAENEWKANGYPTIDWKTFDERVRRHFPDLEKLLVPDCTSFYRNVLASNKTGKAKNFSLTLGGDDVERISCGYYGTRGSDKMLHVVMDRFSAKLRRLAASDDIVKAAGVGGYAQNVLVPELAMRLVKEDMRVSDDCARQILRESIHLGQKMNPAPDDVVPLPDEAEYGQPWD